MVQSSDLSKGPCYGLVQRVYKNGDVKVILYPDADDLSRFIFKPGQPLEKKVSCKEVYGDAPVKGQLVRFDHFLGKPRYLVCQGRFQPGQLKRWEDRVKKFAPPEVVSRYSDLVNRKFAEGLSNTAEGELERLSRIIDSFTFYPVREFLDELEKMLLEYMKDSRPDEG